MNNIFIAFIKKCNQVFAVLAFFSLAFVGCQSKTTTDETASESEVANTIALHDIKNNPNIEIGTLKTKKLQTKLTCTGILDIPPTDRVSVHSKVEGFLTNLNFIDGDYVKKGSVLAEIENISFIQKQRSLLELKAQLETAEKSLQRQQILEKQDATSQKELDAAVGQVALLKASYTGLKKELELCGFRIHELEQSSTFQSVLPILAPATGVISHVAVNKGQMIHPDDQLLEILNTAHVHVELKIFPTDTMRIAVNQSVTFQVPNSSKVYEAFVWKINPNIELENNTRNIHCHLKKESESSELLPGTIVQAQLYASEKVYLGLPLEAVVKSGDTYFAFMIKENGIKKVALEQATVTDDFVAFPNAVAWANDTFVIKGAYYLER